MRVEEIAHAKINLALHVRHRRADGYHAIETIFAFAEEGDRLSFSPAEALRLEIGGPFATALAGEDPADNLVMRAAARLRAIAGAPGAVIQLDKRLPVAAGIGGGSADAAAALRGLARLWGCEQVDLMPIAAGLGSDVPACLVSRTVRGDARGDVLTPIAAEGVSRKPLLLVNPGVPLATAPVFAGWDGVDRGPLVDGTDFPAMRNDLEPAARALRPEIGVVLDVLAAQPGIELARMSGSGATCFALFGDRRARDAADTAIGAHHPAWWRLATGLR